MPKFAANLSMLWPDLDVYDRFRAAAEAGFSRVEILFVHALDTQRIKQQLQEHGLELVLFDPEPGDWEGGERGIAWDPRRRGEFQRTIHAALETARLLGVHRLNVLTGSPPADVSLANVHAALVESFAWAAPLAESAGVDLLVENINTTDFPGYYVSSVQRAAQLVQDVNRSNVRVQLDQYHVAWSGETRAPTCARTWTSCRTCRLPTCRGVTSPAPGSSRCESSWQTWMRSAIRALLDSSTGQREPPT